MEKRLIELVGSTTRLFDGLEENIFGQEFEVVLGNHEKISINPSLLDDNKFKNLPPVIGESTVSAIAESKRFSYEAGLFPGYVGTDGLDLRYLFVENVLLIFSIGEYQPARYKLYFEGAWQVG